MRERGSVLALMPAAALVFIVLGSLAADAAIAYLGEREVSNVAAAIANDAATQSIDLDRYYATGQIVLLPERVRAVADAALARESGHHLESLQIDSEVIAPDRVRVSVRARVRSLFAKALPSGLEYRTVDAAAEATAERG